MIKNIAKVISGAVLGLIVLPVTSFAATGTDNGINIDDVFQTPSSVLKDNSATIDIEKNEAILTNMKTGRLSQVGALWNKTGYEMDFSKDFHMVAYVSQESPDHSFKTAADGLMFVIQGIGENAPVWYTESGGSLGALRGIDMSNTLDPNKASKKPGIPNSVGIEFDTYFNDPSIVVGPYNPNNYMDGFLSEQWKYKNAPHTAVVFPSSPIQATWGLNWINPDGWGYNANYVGVFLGNWQLRVDHYNATPLTLIDGTPVRLEVNYRASDKQMTYRIGSGKEAVVNKDMLKANVFDKGVTKAYWGFTASTGPNAKLTSTQKISFDQLPGIVNGQASTTLYDESGKNAIENNATLSGGSKVTVKLNATRLSGSQPWENIKVSSNLPDSLTKIPGTTTRDGKKLADATVWKENLLSETIPVLKDTQSSEITFQAMVNQTTTYTNQEIVSDFEGDNMMYRDIKSVMFNTQAAKLWASFSTPIEGDSFLYKAPYVGETSEPIPVKINWGDSTKGEMRLKLEIIDSTNKVLTVKEETDSTGTGTGVFESDIADILNATPQEGIAFGEFKLRFTATPSTGDPLEVYLNLKKKSRPYILDSTKLTGEQKKPGEELPIKGRILDFDSEQATVHLLVDGKEVLESAPIIGLGLPETKDFMINWKIPENIEYGKHKVSIYAKDNDNPANQSAITDLGEFLIEGTLTAVFPESFVYKDIKVSNKAIRSYIGPVGVIDTRSAKKPWTLSASLEKNFSFVDEKGSNNTTPSNFFSYRHKVKNEITGKEELKIIEINEDGTKEPLLSGVLTNEESSIMLSQDEDLETQDMLNGFYIQANTAMKPGEYQATVIWNLEDSPTGGK